MKYVSTRGFAQPSSFINAVLEGLAPDGGLYVPQTWPRLDDETLSKIPEMKFAEVAAQVLKAFAGDELEYSDAFKICENAYGKQWHADEIVPCNEIAENTFLMELFHGPSLAFKDVAMQMIGALFEFLLEKLNRKLSIICATSGDTGGAAVEAFKNRRNISLFVMMPDGRVSEVQKRFMTASGADNVHCLILDGDFDKAQALLKRLLADKDFVKDVNLAPVNSVNFARIIAQSVYFLIHAQKIGKGKPVDFYVPTGNFGDAFSGWVAKQLGANIGRIIMANNANNSLAIAMQSGKFAIGEHSVATISPAMDIQVPSNFERILYELSNGEIETRNKIINAAFESLKNNKSFEIDAKTLENLQKQFGATYCDDAQTIVAIKDCKTKTGEIICPHTAIAWAASQKADDQNPKIILATAHAAKFPETLEEVLDVKIALPDFAADLFSRSESFLKTQAQDEIIKNYIYENR